MKMKTCVTNERQVGKSYLTTHQAIQTCLDKTLTVNQIEERTKRLNRKIERLNKKLSTQKKKLEDRIQELENQKWKYHVDEIVLYDDWRRVKITGLLHNKEYLYSGYFIDGATNSSIMFTQEELSEYDPNEYEVKLLRKIYKLKNDLNKIKGYGKYF